MKKSIDTTKVIQALARIHYSFEESLADIIDNSIDAKADTVNIQFLEGPKKSTRVIISDNGKGMSHEKLNEAIVIGSNSLHSPRDLGKYGMGLKVASMNQTSSFFVVSKSLKTPITGLKYEIFRDKEPKETWLNKNELKSLEQFFINQKQGTIVIWDLSVALYENINRLLSFKKRIQSRLGIIFHTFISTNKLNITIYCKEEKNGQPLPSTVTSIDPFNYKTKKNLSYPKKFKAKLSNGQNFEFIAHCWPPNSKNIEYRLPTIGASSGQGFYFYRNRRLIQIGGWNEHESKTDPHLSLARIEINITEELENIFSVNVQKTAVSTPFEFWDSIKNAKSADGSTWKNYNDYVKETYNNDNENKPLEVLPGSFLSKELKNSFKDYYSHEKEFETANMAWKKLSPAKVLNIDFDNYKIELNSIYKNKILNNVSTDEQFHLLLFLVLSEPLKKGNTKKVNNYINLINILLLKIIG